MSYSSNSIARPQRRNAMSSTLAAYPSHLPARFKVAGFRILEKREPGVFSLPLEKLGRRELTIGRADDQDVRIRHSTVSRRQCVLARNVDGQLMLLNTSANNPVRLAEYGQYSRSRPIEWRIMEVGDHFRLGKVTLVAVDADGRCPLGIWNVQELVRHAIKLYGSEQLACKYLNMPLDVMAALRESETS